MYLLGYDIGSSSVKASLVDAVSGRCVATDFFPKKEMPIMAVAAGMAEQSPDEWWRNLQLATQSVLHLAGIDKQDIKAIGISYQMHGLVALDREGNPLRPAIIWCDSRGVPYGKAAFDALGETYCLDHLLQSPGNFTASKLAWVKEHEPAVYERIDKILLPGDYIALRLTGNAATTLSGLSEGIFWDFKENCVSQPLMSYFGFDNAILPHLVPTMGEQGYVTARAAHELGLQEGTPVTYRAGDQPNNALSLNVMEPGEIASTAGTSGVVYGISDQIACDRLSRINLFAHVNHTVEHPRLGLMTCINGTGILNSWLKHNVVPADCSYDDMNALAAQVPVGACGVSVIPFGNGAERILQNRETGASVHGLSFTTHDRRHLLRAAQEGIVYSFMYGMEIMAKAGMQISVIKAGVANMFLSPIFRATLAGISGATIELYNTDGSVGAAKGAGIGAGIYADTREAFATLQRLDTIEPSVTDAAAYREAYELWKSRLQHCIRE